MKKLFSSERQNGHPLREDATSLTLILMILYIDDHMFINCRATAGSWTTDRSIGRRVYRAAAAQHCSPSSRLSSRTFSRSPRGADLGLPSCVPLLGLVLTGPRGAPRRAGQALWAPPLRSSPSSPPELFRLSLVRLELLSLRTWFFFLQARGRGVVVRRGPFVQGLP